MTQKEERLNHQKQLSATEKLIKIRQLKAEGKTQIEVAKELGISRRTVCQYWNSTEVISKQEAKRKPKPIKRRWNPRINGQSGYSREKLLGVTPLQYDKMFVGQEGKCGICGKHQTELNKSLSVDHDHITTKIRGLLCSKCNLMLGLVDDNIDILTNAVKYLSSNR